MVRLKLRTCSINGISMKPSRRAQSVTSHSLIIVREFELMQGSRRTLFYYYAHLNDSGAYSAFLDDIKELCPLHCTRIRDGLLTFESDKTCSCGHRRS